MWTNRIVQLVAGEGPVVRVCTFETKGSTPRECGAAMLVTAARTEGTIGGGTLEFDAIAQARSILTNASAMPWQREVRRYSLGPSLGQCCGGHVKLLFEKYGADEAAYLSRHGGTDAKYVSRDPDSAAPVLFDMEDQPEVQNLFSEPLHEEKIPLYLYGAGHVAREVVRVLAETAMEIVWVDTDEERFPDAVPENITRIISPKPETLSGYAPDDACHLIMTYSHPIDLEICHAVLRRGRFRYLGLIGSATKRARFEKRLRELGIASDDLSLLTCPIGIEGLYGKAPPVIAISVAAQILKVCQTPEDRLQPRQD